MTNLPPEGPPPPPPFEEPPESWKPGVFLKLRPDATLQWTEWRRLRGMQSEENFDNPARLTSSFLLYGLERKGSGQWVAYIGQRPERDADAMLKRFNPNFPERSSTGDYASVVQVPIEKLELEEKVTMLRPPQRQGGERSRQAAPPPDSAFDSLVDDGPIDTEAIFEHARANAYAGVRAIRVNIDAASVTESALFTARSIVEQMDRADLGDALRLYANPDTRPEFHERYNSADALMMAERGAREFGPKD